MTGLLVYGPPAVGKSTLTLNLRRYYFGNPLTHDQLQYNDHVCFLGKTVKSNGLIMSTGGAESLRSVPWIPDVNWVIADVPTQGKDGADIAIQVMRDLDNVLVVCLHTASRDGYHAKRTQYFSGREPKRLLGEGKIFLPLIHNAVVVSFETERLPEAVDFCIGMIGNHNWQSLDFMTLEEIGEYYGCSSLAG